MLQTAGLYDMVVNVYEDVDVVLWSVDNVKLSVYCGFEVRRVQVEN
jgi:hypothetical protein